MQAAYARHYHALWEEHWWWRSRAEWLVGWIERIAGGRRDLRILDAGCGDGLFFDELARFGDVEGLEPDERLLTGGRHRASIRVGLLDATFRPERPYDLVLMLDVLEHCPDEAEALAAAVRAIRPEGRLLATVPALPALWSAHDEVNGHFRRYTKTTLRRALGAAGLVVEEVRWFYLWTVGPLVLRKLLRPAGAADADVAIPPRLANGLLRRVSRIDLALARHVRLPVGSSLLAIARRPAGP
jgi:SAM-dependent methyltransferase